MVFHKQGSIIVVRPIVDIEQAGIMMRKNTENLKFTTINERFRTVALGYRQNTLKLVAVRRNAGMIVLHSVVTRP